MNNSKTINSLKEALRLFWLENAKDADLNLSEHELQLILSSDEISFEMNETKRAKLIDKLYNRISGASLGTLIKENMHIKRISESELIEETKVSKNLLADLKEDRVYPNYVPVLWMKNLLDILGIQFKRAESAILKTYELIKVTSLPVKPIQEVRIAYRKNNGKKKRGSNKWNNADARQLFENRVSLEKYLSLLERHMTTDQK